MFVQTLIPIFVALAESVGWFPVRANEVDGSMFSQTGWVESTLMTENQPMTITTNSNNLTITITTCTTSNFPLIPNNGLSSMINSNTASIYTQTMQYSSPTSILSSTESIISQSSSSYNLTQPQYTNMTDLFIYPNITDLFIYPNMTNSNINTFNYTNQLNEVNEFCANKTEGIYCYKSKLCLGNDCLSTVIVSCPDKIFSSCSQWHNCVDFSTANMAPSAKCLALSDSIDESLRAQSPIPVIEDNGKPALLFISTITTVIPTNLPISTSSMSISLPSSFDISSGTSSETTSLVTTPLTSSIFSESLSMVTTTITSTSIYIPTYCAGPYPPVMSEWLVFQNITQPTGTMSTCQVY